MKTLQLLAICFILFVFTGCSNKVYQLEMMDYLKVHKYCENRILLPSYLQNRNVRFDAQNCTVERPNKQVIILKPDPDSTECSLIFYKKRLFRDSIVLMNATFRIGNNEPEVYSRGEWQGLDSIPLAELGSGMILSFRYNTFFKPTTKICYNMLHIRDSVILGTYKDIQGFTLPEQIFLTIQSKYRPGDRLLLYNIRFLGNGYETISTGKEIIIY